MGAGKKKANEPFAVAPTAVMDPVETQTDDSAGALIPSDAQDHVDAYLSNIEDLDQAAAQPSGVTSYDDLYTHYKGALQNLDGAVASGLDQSMADGLAKQAQNSVKDWAETLDEQALNDAVKELGVEHPHLLSEKAKKGLLDPKYDINHPYKQKIKAKADERYQTLLAGGTHDGMTLADLQAKEKASNWDTMPEEPPNPAAWTPTREEYEELRDRQTATLKTLQSNRYYSSNPQLTSDAMVQAIKDEERLNSALPSADVPQAELDMVRASMTKQLDQESIYFSHNKGRAVGQALLNEGLITSEQAQVISGRQAMELVRRPDSDSSVALKGQIAGYQKDLEDLKGKRAALAERMEADGSLKLASGDPDEALKTLRTRYELRALEEKVGSQFSQAIDPDTVTATHRMGKYQHYEEQQVKQWAAGENMTDLRKVATGLGLDDADKANRAQLTKYIAQSTYSDNGMEQAQASVNKALLKKQAKAAQVQAAAAAAKAPAGTDTATDSAAPAKPKAPVVKKAVQAGSWQAQVEALKAGAEHHAASFQPIPQRMDDAAMASMPLTPTANLNLGGAHSKTYWKGPDGTTYMAKNGGSNNAARAEAEAAASRVLAAGGLPSVPVYRRSVGGSEDAPVQPVLKGVTTMSKDMSSLSQADADAVVRMHVGAWAVGDHDLHDRNVLRTEGGGLIPIDQGQAFKNYGIDKLDVDYHPNAAYGEAPPVFNQMYKAASSGGLAPGVKIRPEAALPVIAKYESIPDDQYRAMLKPTADLGVKHGAFWEKAMRKEAASKLGVSEAAVTKPQIAEAFLDHAVARKKNLRADFAKFFSGQGHGQVGTTFFNA